MSSSNWWDATQQGSFFDQSIYRLGDVSEEGHLLDTHRTVEQRTSREVEGILKLANPEKGARILDCPCGEGRHSIALSSLGFDVIGIDLDPKAIGVCLSKEKTVFKENTLRFMKGNMNNIPLKKESIDLVLNLFFSFGFFDTDEENKQTLSEFYRILTPGGKLIIETDVNPDLIQSEKYGDRKIRTLVNGM